MSSDPVEALVRRSLERWADGVRPSPSSPGAVRRRVAVRRRRRLARGVGVVVVVGGVVALVGEGLRSDGTTSVRTASDGGDGSGASSAVPSDPAMFVLDPPWALTHANTGVDGDGVAPHYMADLAFENGTRSIEVVTYQPGSRYQDGEGSPAVIRGVDGRSINMGGSEFRVGWDEAGYTLEATGRGFPDEAALVAELSNLRFVDEDEYARVLPDGVGVGLVEGIRSYAPDSGGYVVWSGGGATVECNVDGGGGTAHPFDPVEGC